MGLAHGGLRQKAFNAYEETIGVPLVVSNPLLFPRPRRRRDRCERDRLAEALRAQMEEIGTSDLAPTASS